MGFGISRCRGIGDRCKVGRSAGMITVRRDAVRTQGRAPKGGGDQRDREAVGSSSRLEALKSQDTPNLLSPISNIRAVTPKLYSRASSRVEIRPCCKSPSLLDSAAAASFNEGFYKVALICVFEARLHRATS